MEKIQAYGCRKLSETEAEQTGQGPTAIVERVVERRGDCCVALRPHAETTGFRFDLADAQVGQVVTRRVAVFVADADGLSASAELIVSIHITPADADGDFPPICKIKPWLP